MSYAKLIAHFLEFPLKQKSPLTKIQKDGFSLSMSNSDLPMWSSGVFKSELSEREGPSPCLACSTGRSEQSPAAAPAVLSRQDAAEGLLGVSKRHPGPCARLAGQPGAAQCLLGAGC